MTNFNRTITGIALLLLGCSTEKAQESPQAQIFELTSLKSGLLDFRSNREPYISRAGNEFPYVESGKCVVAGDEKACLWHGFEFSYRSPTNSTLIECKFESNRTQNRVTPAELGDVHVTTGTFAFVLQGRSGNYVRLQYTTDLKGRPFQTTTWCMHAGVEVLRFTMTLIP